MIQALIPLLTAVPSIVRCFTGDEQKDKPVLDKVLDAVETVTGTRDPSSAAEVLAKQPELIVQLETHVQEVNLEYFREETERIESVNRTMRVEAKADDPWPRRWRPFWGFVSGGAFGFIIVIVALCLGYVAFKDPVEFIKNLPMIISALVMLFGIPGTILGVTAWHRGKMQRIEAGEQSKPEVTKLAALAEKYFGGKK